MFKRKENRGTRYTDAILRRKHQKQGKSQKTGYNCLVQLELKRKKENYELVQPFLPMRYAFRIIRTVNFVSGDRKIMSIGEMGSKH